MLDIIKKYFRKIIVTFSIALIIFLLWGSFQYWSITKVGEEATPQPADAIIVLGAAVWPQGPSPALQARLSYAVELYNEGYADNLILSGGLGIHPPTEAEAMMVAMVDLGVDRTVLYLEEEATSTVENIKFSKQIMDEHGWQRAIIVSDFFHIKRALLVANDFGVEAYGASAKNSVLYQKQSRRTAYTLREILALSRYYITRFLP